jgi:type IV secretion system protein VirB6
MPGICTAFENKVNALLAAWVNGVVTNFTAALIPLATVGFTIYVILLGWQISRGEVQDSVTVIVKRLMTIAVISALALGVGLYNTYVVNAAAQATSAMVNAVSAGGIAGSLDANGNPINFGNPNVGVYTIGNLLDAVLMTYKNLYNLIAQNFTHFGVPSFAYILAGLFTAVAMFFVVVVCMGFYLLARVELALCLAVGPVFILLATFESTREWTRRWIGQLWHYVVQIALLAGVISMLQGTLITSALMAFNNLNAGGNNSVFSDVLALFVVSLFVCVIAWNIGDLARALTGAIGSLGHGQVLSVLSAFGLGAMRGGQSLAGRAASGPLALAREAFGARSMSNRIEQTQGTASRAGDVPMAQRGTMDSVDAS